MNRFAPSSNYSTITVDNGNTTASSTLVAAPTNGKTRIAIGVVSLPVAGMVEIKSNSAKIAPTIFFSARGTQYFGVVCDGAINSNITADVTLDSAASGDQTCELDIRSFTVSSNPGQSG